MRQTLVVSLSALGLLVGMLLFLEGGRKIGARRLAKHPDGAPAGFGALESAIFGLMGLLVAFTFSGAASRFDTRRHLIVQEANAIDTAWRRLDMLPAGAQPALRESFRRYVDARLAVYRMLPDIQAAMEELSRATALQGEIWAQAVAAVRTEGGQHTIMLILPALNEMFNITTTRTMARKMHPPAIIFVMLGVLPLASSLLAGYGMATGKKRSWMHMLGFVVIMAGTVYVILEIEFPRLGFIRLDAIDHVLGELRERMQ
jgi:hypothetical protein